MSRFLAVLCSSPLLCLLTCTHTQIGESERQRIGKADVVREYAVYLETLDRNSIVHISDAVNWYIRRACTTSQEGRDGEYLLFRRFFYGAIEVYNANAFERQNTPAPMPKSRTGIMPAQDILRSCGLEIVEDQGYTFLQEMSTFMLDTFGSLVSPDIRAFLEIRQGELDKPFQSDGAVIVSFTEIAKRCVTWEAYLDRFSRSKMHSEAQEMYMVYMSVLLTGTTNSHVLASSVEDRTSKNREDIMSAFEYVRHKHPKSKVACIIVGYERLLERSGFLDTLEIRGYLKDCGVKFMYGSGRLDR